MLNFFYKPQKQTIRNINISQIKLICRELIGNKLDADSFLSKKLVGFGLPSRVEMIVNELFF